MLSWDQKLWEKRGGVVSPRRKMDTQSLSSPRPKLYLIRAFYTVFSAFKYNICQISYLNLKYWNMISKFKVFPPSIIILGPENKEWAFFLTPNFFYLDSRVRQIRLCDKFWVISEWFSRWDVRSNILLVHVHGFFGLQVWWRHLL